MKNTDIKKSRQSFAKPIATVLLAFSALVLGATAGSLTPSALPSATMASLSDIWNSIASATYDSSAIVANQNGSLLSTLKYIEQNTVWASASNNAYYLGSGLVSIGTSSLPVLNTGSGRFVGDGTSEELVRLNIRGAVVIDDSSANLESGLFINGASTQADLHFYLGGTNKAQVFYWNRAPNADSPEGLQLSTWAPYPLFGNSGHISFNAGYGIRRMYISGITGYVNIGENGGTPSERLEVNGNILASTSGNVDLILNSTTSDDTKFTIRSVGASDRLDILGSASQTYMTILKGGNIGIGTTTPADKLAVAGNIVPSVTGAYSLGTTALRWSNLFAVNVSVSNSFEANIASVSQFFVNGLQVGAYWSRSGTNTYLANIGDNVGIGDSTPETKFEVVGTASISGNSYFSGFVGIGTTSVIDSASKFSVYGTDVAAEIVGNGSARLDLMDRSAGVGQKALEILFDNGVFTMSHMSDGMSVRTNRLVMNSAGNVGICSTVDCDTLSRFVVHASGSDGNLRIKVWEDNTSDALVSFQIASGSNKYIWNTGVDVSDAGKYKISYSNGSFNSLGFGERLTIETGGNVGIGTSSPATRLSVVGLSGPNDIFSVASSSGSSFLRVTKGGNVGIGTINVDAKLEVAGTASISGATTLRGVTYTWPSVQGGVSTYLRNNGSGTLTWAAAVPGATVASDSLDFEEFVDAMTLDATTTVAMAGYNYVFTGTGNVGIGTTAPETKLELVGTASVSIGSFGSGGNSERLVIKNNGLLSPDGGITIMATASYIGGASTFTIAGRDSSADIPIDVGSLTLRGGTGRYDGGGVLVVGGATTGPGADAGWVGILGGTASGSSSIPGRVEIVGGTHTNCISCAGADVVIRGGAGEIENGDVILQVDDSDSRGRVGIGTGNPTARLHVASTSDGNILKLTDSTGTCAFNPDAGGLGTSCSSDERLKSNIVDAPPILEYLSDFHIRQYAVNASGRTATGVIAQELLQTRPELVASGSDGFLMVTQPSVWQLVKGIQELEALIAAHPLTLSDDASLLNRIVGLFSSVLGIEFGQGSIRAGHIELQELCVGSVCVTEEQFMRVFGSGAGAPESPPASASMPVSSDLPLVDGVASESFTPTP